MNIILQAAEEIERVAADWRATNAREVEDDETGIVGWNWPDPKDHDEYLRLVNLAHDLREEVRRLYPLGEAALNPAAAWPFPKPLEAP